MQINIADLALEPLHCICSRMGHRKAGNFHSTQRSCQSLDYGTPEQVSFEKEWCRYIMGVGIFRKGASCLLW